MASQKQFARLAGFRRAEVALYRPLARRPRRRRLGRSRQQDGVLFRRLRRRHLEDRGWRRVLAMRVGRLHGQPAVGSIAVAPSDPNVIYAGTGETAIRLDVSYGDGLYKSTDAGRTWSNVGLRNSKFIGRICIHPQNPDLVYVAALGDMFGPNARARRLSAPGMAARAGRDPAPQRRARARSISPWTAPIRASCSPRCGRRGATSGTYPAAARAAGCSAAPTAATRGRRSRRNPGLPTACWARSACRFRLRARAASGRWSKPRATRPGSTAPTTSACAGPRSRPTAT